MKKTIITPPRTFALAEDTRGRATYSKCRQYRYALERLWEPSLPPAVFIGLNPSQATAERDDPTVRRCSDFARTWGAGGLVMLNLFAFRATDPVDLKDSPNPIGPRNDEFLRRHARQPGLMVAAWGIHGVHQDRGHQVLKAIGPHRLHCLGLTVAGHPRHPLYLRGDTRPVLLELALRKALDRIGG